ncbi:MAG: DUF374 domain-containing protein, partial [Planctomycetaceae bacterium]|nr:DUF374 domain-containing protein [Planctomycetaceae bacterium]
MKIRSRWLTLAAARGIVSLMRLLFWTCRCDVVAEADQSNPYEETGESRYLYSIWHDQIIMTLFTGRPKKMAGLVSRHQDGSYVADTMSLAGIQPVRGSTSRGGAQALRELMHAASEYHIA